MKNISEAKAQLSALIEEVLRGGEVIIGKAGRPVAKIIPYNGVGASRKPGSMKGKIKISPDFDELPEDLQAAFGMKK